MEDQWKTALAIIAACMTMGSFALFFVIVQVNHSKKHLQKDIKIKSLEIQNQALLLRSTIEIEEKEKQRIFDNLHDQINPMLRFVVRRLELHRDELATNQLKAKSLDEDVDLLLKAIEGLRSCTHELVPSFLFDFGLEKSLEEIVRKFNLVGNIKTSFHKEGDFYRDLPFKKNEQLSIYRMCLEITSNILRHTGCTWLEMHIRDQESVFIIEMKHNGRGIDNSEVERLEKNSTGKGLRSSKIRAMMLSAELDYLVEANYAAVVIRIPAING